MAKYNYAHSNFLGGQIGPKAFGRIDSQEYANGCELIENMIPYPHGGLTKRCGSYFLSDLGGQFLLLPFQVSREESYILAINTNPSTITLNNCLRVYGTDGIQRTLSFLPSHASFTGYPNITPFYRSISLTESPATIYFTESKDYSKFAQIRNYGFDYVTLNDVMILTHASGEMAPFAIIRTSSISGLETFAYDLVCQPTQTDTSGALYLGEQVFNLRMPYKDPNVTALTLTPSATTGTTSLTASLPFFSSTQVGTCFRLTHGTTEGVAIVYRYVSSTSVLIRVIVNFGATTATTNWTESSFGRSGWPKTVTFFEERLCFGGTIRESDRIFASLQGNIYRFMERRLLQDVASNADTSGLNYFIPGTMPDDSKEYNKDGIEALITDPWQFQIGSNEGNSIKWMTSRDSIIFGTDGGEYIMDGVDTSLSRASVRIKRQTYFGGTHVKPAQVGQDILFVERNGKRVRNFRFNRENGSYISNDMNLLSSEIIGHNIVDPSLLFDVNINQIHYQPNNKIIWIITDLNQLIGFLLDATQNVIAWHVHTLGGVNAQVHSIVSLPDTETSDEVLFALVSREISSVTEYYLERIGNDFTGSSLNVTGVVSLDELPLYLDAALFNPLPNISVLTGLTHIAGETARVFAGGVEVGDYVVSVAGEITLTSQVSYPIVGLPYYTNLKTLKLNMGSPLGSALGNMQRIDRVSLRIHKAYSYQIGSNVNNLQLVNHGTLYTGDYINRFIGGPDLGVQVLIRSHNAYPLTILAMALRGETND